ncbi:DTW domain-containing protein [Pseudomonas sp. MTM4]|uniref:tRNA-uridine aminocarboxypropyltransferase n=1 Tax=unclassified Pseudomonas TaxID=196821 RepID=UPI0018D22ABA|nr:MULTISPECIES: DTW domain-containing protein [unclassified Pseudomonas]MBC8651012.1 DTW domain-containing protein [Pseudomonas sp. MT4]QXY91044.1 DTW domain-containing protein [Pseudomonas sp. MTM4]
MPRPRCTRCQRPLKQCLCALIPSLVSETEVLILQHPSETGHALNTARLAALGLTSAELRVGERFDDLPVNDSRESYLLFPGDDAVSLAQLAAEDRPLRLVVPDGTWRKARKLLHLNPALASLPRVALPEGLTSRYRLRKAPMPGALSTLEAIVVALNALEGAGRFDALLRPFEALIETQIDAMGAEVFQRNHGCHR